MCKAIGDLAKHRVTLKTATAPKVPKAKIMRASTLAACLASVAQSPPREGQGEPSKAAASRPEPVPHVASSCTPSPAVQPCPPALGR